MSNYFLHDAYNSDIQYYESLENALKCAKELIEESNIDGWPQEILDGAIKVGIVLYESAMTNERESDDERFDYICDCEMLEIEHNTRPEAQIEINKLKSQLAAVTKIARDVIANGEAFAIAMVEIDSMNCRRDEDCDHCLFVAQLKDSEKELNEIIGNHAEK